MAGTIIPHQIRNEHIRLVKVDHDNFYALMQLSVTEEQLSYIAPNALSMSEAFACLSNGDFIECFGVFDADVPVGFVMLCHDPADDDDPEGCYCIWRLMIDQRYQGRGFGHDALKLVLDHILTFPDGEEDDCFLSYEPENVAAKSLYASFGFVPTGRIVEGEEEAVVQLR